MKKLVLIGFILVIAACKPAKPDGTKSDEKMLIGKHPVKELFESPYRDWFAAGYDQYKPDAAVIAKLRSVIGNIHITIFAGTWCPDSHEQLPHFYKVLNEIQIPEKNVTLILMDRSKTTPENLEAGLNITNVPTFIFEKRTSGKSGEKVKVLNRIVETPIESLEKDMLKILTNQSYSPNYAK